jgi:hypothetical protein
MDFRNLTGEISPDLILFEKATKLKKHLRNTRILRRPQIKTLMETIPPNKENLKKCNEKKSCCDVFSGLFVYKFSEVGSNVVYGVESQSSIE